MKQLFNRNNAEYFFAIETAFKYRTFDVKSKSYVITMKLSADNTTKCPPTYISLFVGKILMFVSILVSFIGLNAQTVFSVEYASRADVKLYVVDYESQADLLVYKVSYESQATKNDGKWFFTEYESQAAKKVYFVEYESQADLKIFFVQYESQAGWRKKEKQHLMY